MFDNGYSSGDRVNLEEIARYYYVEPEADPSVLIPVTQGNMHYIYSIMKDMCKPEFIRFLELKQKNFEKKSLSIEGKITREFLEKTLKLVLKTDDFCLLKKQMKQLIYIGMKARIEYHKKIWETPDESILTHFQEIREEFALS